MSVRIFWLGLDGADEESFGRLLREGRLPHLAAALDGGTVAALRSSALPITPAAWASMYTGMNPGKTGILTWQASTYDYAAPIVTHDAIAPLALHRRLADANRRFASIGFPLTSPLPTTSFVLSGWDGPGDTNCNDLSWQPRLAELGYAAEDEFATDEAALARNVRARFRIARALASEGDWDCLAVFFSFIDHLGHRLGARSDLADALLELVDVEFGAFVDTLDRRPTILVNSDHGFGTFARAFSVTQWLGSLGYLTLGSNDVHRRSNVHGLENVNVALDTDWTRTRAYCVDAIGSYAAIRINTATLLPLGIVDPREVARVCDAIRADALAARSESGAPLVTNVWRRDELFWGPMSPYLPDLVLECSPDTVALVGKWETTANGLRLASDRFVHDGTFHSHRADGIWASSFPCTGDLRVEDVAATVYGLLGVPIPSDVDGVDRSGLGRAAQEQVTAAQPESQPYTAEEEELVRKRLEALGYL